MLWNILVAAAVAVLAFMLIWLLRGIVLTPVPRGRNIDIRIVLTVSGGAGELENTVDALAWLRKNGTLDAEIEVHDAGMDEETAHVARLLARAGMIELN